uniref:Uncharacterized protein n=1 Tax=Lynx canadensis TaxID=61383 RepID=A0A667I8U1_LYNCA
MVTGGWADWGLGRPGARIQQSRRVFRPLESHLCEQRHGCPFSTVSLTPGASGALKKDLLSVKQIMEEAATRKFVHEDSSHIISFCDTCFTCPHRVQLLIRVYV